MVVECPPGREVLDVLRPALAAALDGSGPAVVPVPATDTAVRTRVLAAVRPDEGCDPRAAVLVATSGSTGEPKGVLLGGSALRASAEGTHSSLGGPGQWLLTLPATHIAGLQVVLRSMLAGTEPVVLDGSERFTAERFVTATEALSGSRRYTSLVPTQLGRLVDAGGAALRALSTYDAVLVGGAAASPSVVTAARDAGARVVLTYGMTETCGGCVYDRRPLPGVSVSVDVGGVGRIRLSGPVLALGYHRRPHLTAAAFVDGAFLTGDLGRVRPDGSLDVLGRADDVIVTGGVKVASAAVEAVLAACDGVGECAVVGVPDQEWGHRVVAFVVARATPPLRPEALRRAVADELGRAWAPREVVVVRALPVLPSGKVDRAALVSAAVLAEAGQSSP